MVSIRAPVRRNMSIIDVRVDSHELVMPTKIILHAALDLNLEQEQFVIGGR